MSHQIIAAYIFRRQQQRINAIDAVTETAEYFGVSVAALAAAILPLETGVSAARLSNLI